MNRIKIIAVIAAAGLTALAACSSSSATTRAAAPTRPTATSAPPSTPALSCASFGGLIQKVVADRTAQKKLMSQEGTSLPQLTKDDIASGAWSDPGTYSSDLDSLVADVNQSGISFGSSGLASTLAAIAHDGTSVQNDKADGAWQADPATADSDWQSFTADIIGPAASAAVTPLSAIC